MRVIILATITADGYIARNSHELVDWSSRADKGVFVKLTREMGVIVMGANTFATVQRNLTTHNRRVIVYTRNPAKFAGQAVETTQDSPAELISRLQREGAAGLAVCGGTEVYTQFMAAGVVTDLYLVSEPIVIGQGITIFNAPITAPIELFESSVRRGHSVVNHYKVVGSEA